MFGIVFLFNAIVLITIATVLIKPDAPPPADPNKNYPLKEGYALTWHPILMVAAFGMFSLGTIAYKHPISSDPRLLKYGGKHAGKGGWGTKTLHVGIQGVGTALLMGGFIAIVVAHVRANGTDNRARAYAPYMKKGTFMRMLHIGVGIAIMLIIPVQIFIGSIKMRNLVFEVETGIGCGAGLHHLLGLLLQLMMMFNILTAIWFWPETGGGELGSPGVKVVVAAFLCFGYFTSLMTYLTGACESQVYLVTGHAFLLRILSVYHMMTAF
eukprot:g3079.t1